MAFVVARANGRFEIRESVHTPKGPRARSLANFELLSEDVLVKAMERATRPFDPVLVLAAADRLGAAITPGARQASMPARTSPRPSATPQTVTKSKPGQFTTDTDPGDQLIQLLLYADQVAPFRAEGKGEPLLFPPLAALIAKNHSKGTRARR